MKCLTTFVLSSLALMLTGCASQRQAPAPTRLNSAPPRHQAKETAPGLVWHDARGLLVEGRGWPDSDPFYGRLPDRASDKVPKLVWQLSKHAAGLCVRFVTDSKRIGTIWDGGGAMNHMAATGNSGLDLYARRDGQWEFCGVGRPKKTQTTALVAHNLPGKPTEYLLYLPLYNKVTELKIGIDPNTSIRKAPPRPKETARPIIFYGTSITQGGCASRAGMCHPAILGRWLNREVVNLGFSGAGKMEPALAELLGELDAAVFVLECLPNMTTDMVRQRVEPFVHTLRQARPETPVLLVESPFHAQTNPGNAALRNAFDTLRAQSVPNLHYLTGDDLLAGRENGTVDGVYPTDLGFFRMATAYVPVLQRILAGEGAPPAGHLP